MRFFGRACGNQKAARPISVSRPYTFERYTFEYRALP